MHFYESKQKVGFFMKNMNFQLGIFIRMNIITNEFIYSTFQKHAYIGRVIKICMCFSGAKKTFLHNLHSLPPGPALCLYQLKEDMLPFKVKSSNIYA